MAIVTPTSSTASASTDKLRIIIVGAGIAGLAAARALREQHEVIVLEQSRLKSEVGAAIHMGPNASRITLQWGLDPKRLNSPEVCKYAEYSPDAKLLFCARMDPRKDFGAPWLLNHRVDLHNELRRLATTEEVPGTPAEIRTSARVASVDCEKGTVTLEDGEIIRGDLIIGADGIHSVVRNAVLGSSEFSAQPSGHSAYRALIPAEKILQDDKIKWLLDEPGVLTFIGSDRRLVAYPCRGMSLLNIVAIVPDKFMEEGSTESWSAQGSITDLKSNFSTFADELQRLLGMIDTCGLWQLRDQDPLSHWTRGRVIIIGDAAHAMLPHQGQGGGQSIEDAEALGAILADLTAKDTALVPERLKFVEQTRLERASLVQGYSREKALGPKPGQTGSVNAHEFVGYNFGYAGVKNWVERQGMQWPTKPTAEVAA